jgi:hypothetical protein
MLIYKIYGTILLALCLLTGCIESRYNFDVQDTLQKRSAQFLGRLPGVGRVPYLGMPIATGAKTVEVYKASFKETSIEKDNLLEFSALNDSSTIARADYRQIDGFVQDLYLLHYQFAYNAGGGVQADAHAVVFLSLRYRPMEAEPFIYCTGPGPLYWGLVNEGYLSFDSVLHIRQSAAGHWLGVQKQRKGSRFNLLFMPDVPMEGGAFNIVKIVRMAANRIGGSKPLVFDIPAVFGDSQALHFDLVQTITL